MDASQTFAQHAGAWLRDTRHPAVSAQVRKVLRHEVDAHRRKSKGSVLAKPMSKDTLLRRAVPKLVTTVVNEFVKQDDFKGFLGQLLGDMALEWVSQEPLVLQKFDVGATSLDINVRGRFVGNEVADDEMPQTTNVEGLSAMFQALRAYNLSIEPEVKKIEGEPHLVYNFKASFSPMELPTETLGADGMHDAAVEALGTVEVRELVRDLRALIG